MKVFLDVKFTGLHQFTTPISLALMDQNKRLLYIEFTDYNLKQLDEWTYDNIVWRLWSLSKTVKDVSKYDYHIVNREYAAKIVKEWIKDYDIVELIGDCCYFDMILLLQLFGGSFSAPSNLSPAIHDINQDISRYYNISEKQAFDKDRCEIIPRDESVKRNAAEYVDMIREMYLKLNEGRL